MTVFLYKMNSLTVLLGIVSLLPGILCGELPLKEAEELIVTYEDARKYNEVCWLTAHNAFSNKADGWVYYQQTLGFEEQYAWGVRSFQLDLHWYTPREKADRYIALCHEPKPKYNCLFTRGQLLLGSPKPAKEFFEQVAQWLSSDPKAIITLHLENYVKGTEGREALDKLLEETNLKQYLLRPTSIFEKGDWKTLGQMRDDGTRLVIFSDNPTDGMINVREYRETQYNLDESPNCEMRGEGRDRGKNKRLLLMNHFYSQSFLKGDYNDNNSYNAIAKRVNICHKEQGRLPNFIAVDFIELGANGGSREVVRKLNLEDVKLFANFPGKDVLDPIIFHVDL